MNYFKWSLSGIIILVLILSVAAGCGVAQSDYDALLAQKQALENEKNSLQSEYDAVKNELSAIEEVYPPREFSSRTQLENWLFENDVSDKPESTYVDGWFSKALEIQNEALLDGYIVSADYDYFEADDTYLVFCTTMIDGYVWY
jgi:hypothetical protein